MRRHSYTSSSDEAPHAGVVGLFRRLPIAGVAALALVIMADRVALGRGGPWEVLREGLPFGSSTALERGLATDQVELQRLSDAKLAGPRAIVLGSSRANAAFNRAWVPQEVQDRLVIAKLAHGGVGPFELRVMVEEVLSSDPAIVIFFLSEFDTHHPFSIAPSGPTFHWPAVRDLARLIEGRFFVQQRTRFLRLIAARWSRTYRFRGVLRRGLLAESWQFHLDEPRLSQVRTAGVDWVGRDRRESRVSLPAPERERFFAAARDALPDLPDRGLRAQMGQITTIELGPDVAIQMGLLWATFERLRGSGVEVIMVEAPVHPVAEAFVDPSAREDFQQFAKQAEKRLGIHLIPLQDSGPFGPEDYSDLTHLAGHAGKRLTRRTVELVVRVLEQGEPVGRGSGRSASPPRGRRGPGS